MPSMSINDVHDSTMSPKEKQRPVGDPNKRPRIGRPLKNRKQSTIEKIIKKVRKSSKKNQPWQGNTHSKLASINDGDVEATAQESVNFKMSQMEGSHVRMWTYDLNETPMDLENDGDEQ